MEKWKQQGLFEIKRTFVERGWEDGLFQFLYVMENVKPGFWLQKIDRKSLKKIRNVSGWFDLYVSKKHGGYVTKDKTLYKSWNRIFGFELDAEKYIGYPACCVEHHNTKASKEKLFTDIYILIKLVKENRMQLHSFREIMLPMLLLNHMPCKATCRESHDLGVMYLKVLNKYGWLVEDLLPAFYERMEGGLVQCLERLPEMLKSDCSTYKELAKEGVPLLEYREILNNTVEFRQNLEYARQLLSSIPYKPSRAPPKQRKTQYVKIPEDRLVSLSEECGLPAANIYGMPEGETAIIKKSLYEALSALPYRDRQILKMFFGLGGNRRMTMEEIGDFFYISRERVRQIKEKAILTLRKRYRSHAELLSGKAIVRLPDRYEFKDEYENLLLNSTIEGERLKKLCGRYSPTITGMLLKNGIEKYGDLAEGYRKYAKQTKYPTFERYLLSLKSSGPRMKRVLMQHLASIGFFEASGISE